MRAPGASGVPGRVAGVQGAFMGLHEWTHLSQQRGLQVKLHLRLARPAP